MHSPQSYTGATRDFAVDALDSAVIARIHDDWDMDDYDGMLVFLDEWADGLTMEDAQKLVEDFDLEELGDPETLSERYEHVDDAFYDIEDVLNSTVIQSLNDKSKVAKSGGPEYAAGRDGLRFGLTFHASTDDLEALRKKFPRGSHEAMVKTAQGGTWCLHRAIQLIKDTDFGYTGDAGILFLEQADDLLESCGVSNNELKLAIRRFMTRREDARDLIHGPSKHGTNEGVLNDLIHLVQSPVYASRTGTTMSDKPQFIKFRGATYVRVDEASSTRTAYNLPKKMKGVKPCRPQDQTDEKPKEEQVWCVFDYKGNLRARYKSNKKARQYKVMMIRRNPKSSRNKKEKTSKK